MAYIVRGVDDQGQPAELVVEVCWRCGVPVVTSMVDMAEHVDREHPSPFVMADGETPVEGPLPQLARGYPGPPLP